MKTRWYGNAFQGGVRALGLHVLKMPGVIVFTADVWRWSGSFEIEWPVEIA